MDTYAEKSQKKDKKKNISSSEPWSKKDGYKATLKAEQLLYDGGETFARIDEKKYNYKDIYFETNKKNEDIVFNIVKAYLNLSKSKELNQLMSYAMVEHQKALVVAKEKEEISGEVMETHKVTNMIYTQNDKKLIEDKEYNKALSQYIKVTSNDDITNICRPTINVQYLPKTLEEIKSFALKNSFKIQSQKERIRKQKSILSQSDSKYLPTVKLKLLASYDSDLVLEEQGSQKEANAQISANWNFYSGGRDSSVSEKEKINLLKEQKILLNHFKLI